MKYTKLLILLLIVSLFSLHGLSPTLARFSGDYNGLDTALIAKWDFRVGLSENDLGNSDLTNFDLFEGEVLEPGTSGNKGFFISSGESDVAIEYEIMINAEELIFGNEENQKYLPILFSSNGEEWIPVNTDEYFQVAIGDLDPNSTEATEITIFWKWDASYYLDGSGFNEIGDYNEDILMYIAEMGLSLGNIEFKVEGRQKVPIK